MKSSQIWLVSIFLQTAAFAHGPIATGGGGGDEAAPKTTEKQAAYAASLCKAIELAESKGFELNFCNVRAIRDLNLDELPEGDLWSEVIANARGLECPAVRSTKTGPDEMLEIFQFHGGSVWSDGVRSIRDRPAPGRYRDKGIMIGGGVYFHTAGSKQCDELRGVADHTCSNKKNYCIGFLKPYKSIFNDVEGKSKNPLDESDGYAFGRRAEINGAKAKARDFSGLKANTGDYKDLKMMHTVLNAFASTGDVEAMQELLNNKADINAPSGPAAITPLMAAAQGASVEAVKFALEKGADREARDSKGNRAIDYVNLLKASAPREELGKLLAIERMLREDAKK